MRIVDNSKTTLADVLNNYFPKMSEVAIASAYFNIRGYGAISHGLGDKPLKLLLGREPSETIKWEEEILRELEEFEDDSEYFRLLQKTIEFFKSEKREVRIIEGRFFHGKAFLAVSPSLEDVHSGLAVVGSSNFTYGGLVSNRELNMLDTNTEAVKELAEWFKEQWKTARDFKEDFLKILSNYVTTWSAYEVVAKALYETYRGKLIAGKRKILGELLPHQQLTYIDAMDKLSKYRGVVIADSTGLGKSRVALAIAHEKIKEGKKPLLIAPKAILDTTWKKEMDTTLVHVETLSTERLSQSPEIVEKYVGENGPKLIIVDEAHYFRRSSTNRYQALRELVTKNEAELILITATPVNTSLMNLYNLFKLYLPEDAIMDMGHPSLYDYFVAKQMAWLNGEPLNMDDVLRRFVVRHSRDLAKALDREGRIRFPERVFDDKISRYAIELSLQEIDRKLQQLNLVVYDLSVDRISDRFQLPDGTKLSSHELQEQKENLKNLIKTITRINLFKRLESSLEAFRKSLERLHEYLKRAAEYAQKKELFVPPKLRGELTTLAEDDEDDTLPSPEEVFEKDPSLIDKCRLTREEIEEFVRKCREDVATLEELMTKVKAVQDLKYECLEKRILEIWKDLKEPEGVLIFTQYADTAHYLYRRLREKIDRVMLVTGSGGKGFNGKPIEESEAVELFQRRGGVLISTDVLSAGQNLQNARFVANYDFPWNPVVIIQRVGRADRIGSPYDKIYIVNVLPKNGAPEDPESLEYFLGLMQRLYQRLEAIRETIGLDASTLGEEASPKDFSIQLRIARNDPTVIKELERKIDEFVRDPVDILARIINEKGLEWIEKIPVGVGAVKEGDFEGIFVLFTDDQEFYWRLHDLESGRIITSPMEISEILLSGNCEAKGVRIEYDELVPKLKMVKESLKKEFEKLESIRATGLALGADRRIKTLFNELSLAGEEGERLAVLFRRVANSPRVVELLWNAYRRGKLIEEARQVLSKAVLAAETTAEKKSRPRKLKRVCWCYLRKRREGS